MATTPNRSWPTPDDTDLVRDGAAAIRALGNAIDGTVGQGFVYAGTRYYESSGQFEKADPLGTGDIGLRAIRVRMVGGGGGGGGGDGSVTVGLGGGGAGGYAESFITDIASLPASVTVARGLGGVGGATTDFATFGSTGGSSTFNTSIVATGGLGGFGNGGAGGTGTADFVAKGQAGMPGGFQTQNFAGAGGGSKLGGGARGATIAGATTAGFSDGGFGGGGGGARIQSGTGAVGGAGANGIVIVDCFV